MGHWRDLSQEQSSSRKRLLSEWKTRVCKLCTRLYLKKGENDLGTKEMGSKQAGKNKITDDHAVLVTRGEYSHCKICKAMTDNKSINDN